MKIDQKNARIMNMILDFAKSSWIKTTRKLHQERERWIIYLVMKLMVLGAQIKSQLLRNACFEDAVMMSRERYEEASKIMEACFDNNGGNWLEIQ